nr:hypothetical protein Iba_scaffold7097CG0040 [Ipomoea batatas]GME07933.1 hypothetical protein Iba_scaffold7103CG0520 [Ipomoea batatas]GME07934.1 hypothetical protein Iba_scaffold7103CG0530 [Ipomoea batatas]
MVYLILQHNGTIEPRTLVIKGVMSLLTNSVSSLLKLRMITPLIVDKVNIHHIPSNVQLKAKW